MLITFKNVGQGDSILLEWKKNDDTKGIAIIDCKKENRKNPVLDHIKKSNIRQIDFLIWTHPHSDHHSGMLELLNYCEENNIVIHDFLTSSLRFTTSEQAKRYLGWYVTEIDKIGTALDELFNKIILLYEDKNGIIKSLNPPVSSPSFNLNQEIKLHFLAPDVYEQAMFITKLEKNPHLKESSTANLFSCIIFLDVGESFALLTSDAEKDTFARLVDSPYFGNKKIILAQVPHHGSINNHQINFWRSLRHDTNTPAIISVGINRHGHPSPKVIEDFENEYYYIHKTNELPVESSIIVNNTIALDEDIFTQQELIGNDICFELDIKNGFARREDIY